ncbi:hypothetical protein H696_02603 [Fonticula alba]|uniref:Uncharacterized protein n=1 Tax=Fonticula alba TaxID=691883 RepID=A0A058Z8M2_FONAL|nr:hypothetical protein H696_02603 [Fonticula alba]KCV70273.1 hypothetical protein H696_02603 [Fonticula alba]|eukprot:XP_009494789.1 hypothetical protein H696_02603 [Fonticula alba]
MPCTRCVPLPPARESVCPLRCRRRTCPPLACSALSHTLVGMCFICGGANKKPHRLRKKRKKDCCWVPPSCWWCGTRKYPPARVCVWPDPIIFLGAERRAGRGAACQNKSESIMYAVTRERGAASLVGVCERGVEGRCMCVWRGGRGQPGR